MNIFEKYGIKEVADVVLYAIELDKYDDEVYIPIMYFDTLKVSTVEQTAEQTSARGGLGNPDLIVWDYGKEINVSLEDALFTPASQSLMWGGKFGIKKTKIYGVWDPFVYPTDSYGREIYVNREVYDEPPASGEYIEFVCPCDGETKYLVITPNEGHYKYYRNQATWEQDQLELSYYTCPSDNLIAESEEIPTPAGKYDIATNQLNSDTAWIAAGKPERATITIDCFGQFSYHPYEFVSKEDAEEDENYCYYKEVDFCDESAIKCTDEKVDAYGYVWENTDLKLISMEGNQDIHYIKDTDVRFRIRVDNGIREVSLEYHNENENGYMPKIDIFRNISYSVLNEDGFEEEHIIKVKAGTFYIIDDWNSSAAAPQDFIYEIESGLEDAKKIERMEKCKATRTFAIDADKNMRCNNYRYDKRYDGKELAVFINPRTMKPYEPNATSYMLQSGQIVEGNLTIIKQNETYYKWSRSIAPEYTSLGNQIIVDAEHYPGTYKLVGEAYARSAADGQDERYQFEIPLCKMSSSTSISLQAAGDPTTFNMEFKVLRRDDGVMMKLTQYDVSDNQTGGTTVDVQNSEDNETAFDFGGKDNVQTREGDKYLRQKTRVNTIISPTSGAAFVDSDIDAPDVTGGTGFRKALNTELETNVDNYNVPQENSGYDYNDYGRPNPKVINLYNEVLKQNNTLDVAKDVVVLQTKTYDVYQEYYEVIVDKQGHEQEIPGSRQLNETPILTNVVSNRMLRYSEYTLEIDENNGGEG